MSLSLIPAPAWGNPPGVSFLVFGTCSQPCTVERTQQGRPYSQPSLERGLWECWGGSGGEKHMFLSFASGSNGSTACDRCCRAALQLLTLPGASLVLIQCSRCHTSQNLPPFLTEAHHTHHVRQTPSMLASLFPPLGEGK